MKLIKQHTFWNGWAKIELTVLHLLGSQRVLDLRKESCLHLAEYVKTKNDIFFLFSSKKCSWWESCVFNFQHKMALFLTVSKIFFFFLLKLQFWTRQLLPSNFISTCDIFVTFEKCMVYSANTEIVPEDFSNIILLAVVSNYHKHLDDHSLPQENLGIFRVLKYACRSACVFILTSA